MICDMCGQYAGEYPTGSGVTTNSYFACLPCIDGLIESEIERRGEARDAQALADGQSGSDKLSHLMEQARKVK